MNYLLAAIAGLIFGAAGAFINYRITLSAIKKGTQKALMVSNYIHTAVNIGVLALIFLLRNVLPFDFMVCIVAAAVGLSLLTIVFTFKAAKLAKIEAPQTDISDIAE